MVYLGHICLKKALPNKKLKKKVRIMRVKENNFYGR